MENTISSMEVARMVERRHDQVLRDINKTIEYFGDHKSVGSYFIKANYYTEQNKKSQCFELTRRGCELYATRMSGERGVAFAIAFIDRFHEMEQELAGGTNMELLDFEAVPPVAEALPEPEASALDKLRLMYEAAADNAQEIKDTKSRVTDLEENALIDPGDYHYITSRVNERVKQVAKSFGEINNEQKGLLFRDLNGSIKRVTGVSCRSRLLKKHYDQVVAFIMDWEPSTSTRAIIREMGVSQ